MLTLEAASCSLNNATQADDFLIRTDLLATFDGVSSENGKGQEAKGEFVRALDEGKSVSQAIETLIRQNRHQTTLSLVKLTPEKTLEIYRVGDSRVRIHDQEGKLLYQTHDQNLLGELKAKLGLVHSFYERTTDQVFTDLAEYPELLERWIKICQDFLVQEDASLFHPNVVKRLLKLLGNEDLHKECMREIAEKGYSLTMLKLLYEQSAEFLNYSLGDSESLSYVNPVNIIPAQPGYRIIVGTDGVFANLRESMIRELGKLKTPGFSAKALVYEAVRRSRRIVDATSVVGNLVFN